MAMVKCYECRKKISTSANFCPKCGAPKLDVEASKKSKKPSLFWFTLKTLLLSVVGFLLLFSFLGKSPHYPSEKISYQTKKTTTLEKEMSVPYKAIKKWPIPNGGFSQVVVIDPKFRTIESMMKLGESLRKDTSADRNAFIFIYDSNDAAILRDLALEDQLSNGDLAYHDGHLIGFYMRNSNSNYNALTVTLEGVQGSAIEFPY